MKDEIWDLVLDLINGQHHKNISKPEWERQINYIIGEVEDLADEIEREIDG